MAIIYVLTDPRRDEVRYVGQTQYDLRKRLREHLFHARKDCQTYCARWIRSLLAEGVRPDILPIDYTDAPNEREKYWIKYYRQHGSRLTNCTEGGEDGGFTITRGPLSAEHKAAIAAGIRGRHHTEEAKARMRKPKPPGMAERLSISLTGKTHNADRRRRSSEIRKAMGHAPPMETRSRPGEQNPNSRFTEADIREMRRLFNSGEATMPQIATLYLSRRSVVWNIVHLRSWKHIR